ncbi:MAG: diguanylate cyclase domain-containing protein, partial [Janthinobacterium lividum]
MIRRLQNLGKTALKRRRAPEDAAEAVEALQAGEDYVHTYRCQVLHLAVGLAALGTGAQVVAGYATAAPLWQVLAINAASVLWLLVMLRLIWAGKPGRAVVGASVCMYLTVCLGLLHLNGGYDGTHLYPALWIYSVIGIVGLYGSWLLTVATMVAGIAVVVSGKLAAPDFLFGIGADQSWARVAAMSTWWGAGLLTAGLCGHRVLRIARAAVRSREALHRAREREQVAAAAAARAAELGDAHRVARIGTWRRDLAEGTLALSDELHQLLGTDPRTFEPSAETFLSLVHPEDRAATALALACAASGEGAVEHEWRMLRANGASAWFWAETRLEKDASGRAVAVRGVCQDVTEHRAAAERIHTLAHHDVLTGLANRALLHQRLAEAIARASRVPDSTLAVLYLDLDGFKAVNDLHGHPAGDCLLREVAARLGRNVRETDTVARLGGDEFVVVQTEHAQPEAGRALAERLVAALAESYDLGSDEAQKVVTTSIGIALFPGDGSDPDALLRNADTALYRAKWAGKNGAAFFRPEMDRELRERRALERDLRQATARGEFALA